MKSSSPITHDFLFNRIRESPFEHLGGWSPKLIGDYLLGYEHARTFHGREPVSGVCSAYDVKEWFSRKDAHGLERTCVLLGENDTQALDLFFHFRGLALKDLESNEWRPRPKAEYTNPETLISILDLVTSDAMRTRPALYFGNADWIPGLWAMWNGYIWSEQDLGIDESRDAKCFRDFQSWLDKRHPFGEGAPWGKLFEFLALDVNKDAWEHFYDHLELFLEGEPPDAQTRKVREWIAGCLAEVQTSEENE